jgi:hypothetical protein
MKRGTRVNTCSATGNIIPAVIVRRHKDEPNFKGSDWYVVRFLDDHGGMMSCHREQITITDNRPERLIGSA